ncbi:hypothetical protein [Crocinitomix algicola]|uniref:hypothetical protein n=1 Tax=Crocinitomix algicola TaxID=1740263 RepID=UPI0008353E1A|nr:hypothetical protein [Crocinitomix algicola]
MKGIFLGLILALTFNANAQFSSDPEQFLKDVSKYLGSTNKSKTKDFMEVFEPNWLTNFSSEYQNKVVATSNLIVSKRLPPFPELYGYLLSAHSFVETNQPQASFDSWHATIDALLQSKKVKKFRDFIEVCADFFTNGTIYFSNKHIWQITGGSYIFEFDKNSPNIRFSDVDLRCYIVNNSASKKEDPYYDSTIVRKTSGLYEPLITKWTGRGGTVDWQKVGMDKKTNFAEITDYMMSLKSTKIESDSVLMHTDYYPEPLYGSFSDFAKKIIRESDRVYPQFISFNKKIVKKDILPEVDYVGGFALEGEDFSGVGYESEPATVVFYKDGKPFIKASALRVKSNKSGLTASESEMVMYLSDTDSIYHQGLNVKYDLQTLELARGKEGIAQAPFKDSYHKLDMYVDRIIWTKSDPNLSFMWHPLSSRKIAKFESQDYFNEKVYNEIQGMNQVNPLVAIYKYAYKYDLDVVPVGKVSGAMGYTNEQAIPILLDLANRGFINYNKNKQTLTIQPKLKKYIDARAGRTDYDNVLFVSNLLEMKKQPEMNPDGSPNKRAAAYNVRVDSLNARKKGVNSFGSMNLVSLDFSLNEVDPIEVSPAQNVVIFPDAGEVLVKKNRDFLFKGATMAGKMEIYLQDGAFDYENFKIHLNEVEAALFRVNPMYGEGQLVPMYSHMTQLVGSIEIDHVTNRSGKDKKNFTRYPILNSNKDCYVFYNHKAIYNGVYDSTDFYFKVDPFKFDSLDNFAESTVRFKGEMRSAGIFPVFEEEIVIQPDYSFGFTTQAPESGFDFYGEGAKFDNEIRLSNKGLRGAGEINFVTSNSKSEDFIFFPDSTMGVAQYVNRPQTKDQGISVPDVTGDEAIVIYVPEERVLKVRTDKKPLVMYNKEAVMKGTTRLTEEGMTGAGLVYFKDAELGSKDFDFTNMNIDADTADFNLLAKKTEGEEGVQNPLSFDSRNLKANIDFEERKGEFLSNNGQQIVTFPQNQYICYIDMFTWMMDKDEMELSTNEGSAQSDVSIESDLDLAGSNFYSIHPEQDSLNFKAPKAKFYVDKAVIDCEKVAYLDVADARIFPPEEKVTIRKKAKMDPFEGAEIVANFVTKYHKITEADVQVKARRDYSASGKYPYVDSDENVQIIYFENITLDTAYQTVAKGQITEDANFSLSDKFDFYGGVELYASEQFLTFDGATRINHECNQFARNWLKFRTDVDPNNIQIPVSGDLKDLEGNGVAIGLVRRNTDNSDSLKIYPAFLSALENEDDHILFTSSGVLNYNEAAREFRIASPEKLVNRNEAGNYISLHIESCSMEGDGLVDLGVDIPGVEMNTYGTVNYNMATKLTSMNISGGLNFFFDKKAMEFVTNGIKKSEGISGIDVGRTTFEQAVTEIISKEEAENIVADYALDGEVKKLPKELSQTAFLTNLKFEWSDRAIGFVSKPITGIIGLDGEPLFKDFTVRLALEYVVEGADRGNKLGFLIELPGGEKPGDYYYFRMERIKKNTEMSVITSDKAMQNYILELKDDKLKDKNFSYELKSKQAARYLSAFRTFWGE